MIRCELQDDPEGEIEEWRLCVKIVDTAKKVVLQQIRIEKSP
jgi:hypothetical protein